MSGDVSITVLHETWQEVLYRLPALEVDAVITDPPFGARTHKGQRHGRKDARYTDDQATTLLSARGLSYGPWNAELVREFVRAAEPRCRGWFVAFTSHDLWSAYADELAALGRYVHAPIACVQLHRNVRLAGDGPSNWTDYLVVARPRWGRGKHWGALPGAYVGKPFDAGQNMLDRSKRVTGGKPLWLMRAIVGDYSRPGDRVLDPCAGGGTTGLACLELGRHAVLIDRDAEAIGKTRDRLREAGWVHAR